MLFFLNFALQKTTKFLLNCFLKPDVVELVDTPDLGSGAARCVGSSPIIRTKIKTPSPQGSFYYYNT
jgi:hypothetical protein